MKAKLKFDKKAILDFLAQNGEKLGFAVVVLFFLFFIYRAVGWDRYDKTPTTLKDEAFAATQHIDNCPTTVTKEIRDYTTEIEQASEPISVEAFGLDIALNNPVFDPLSKRGEPALYPVESLRGAPGVGGGCAGVRAGRARAGVGHVGGGPAGCAESRGSTGGPL